MSTGYQIKEQKKYLKAYIVEKPKNYLYSSARNYASMDAVLNIEILTYKWITYS